MNAWPPLRDPAYETVLSNRRILAEQRMTVKREPELTHNYFVARLAVV
jgi:hypothetical protein